LVDALPVHRVVMDSGALKETYVDFATALYGLGGAAFDLRHRRIFSGAEYCALRRAARGSGLEARDWISEVGRRLACGYVLTIDYGHPASASLTYHMRGRFLRTRTIGQEEFYGHARGSRI